MKSWKLLIILTISICFYQNCAPMQSGQEFTNSEASLTDPGEDFTEDFQISQKSCRFIGGEALSSILQNTLNLPGGDVAMLNESGEPLRSQECKSFNHQDSGGDCFYMKEFADDLQTTQCNASTFRIVTQIYTNACAESLSLPENVSRLYPAGSDDISTIHMALTGRSARSDEVDILNELAQEFEEDSEKMVATCAAIGSSLAAINSF